MTTAVLDMTDQAFEASVLQSTTPVLVDFWAEWCQPCKMISPMIEAAAQTYSGRVSVVKVNVDENPETPGKYGVRGIPTLLMFKAGELVATKVGAMSQSQLNAFIEEHL